MILAMLRTLGLLALIVYALSIIGACMFPSSGAQSEVSPVRVDARPEQVIGFAINLHHTQRLDLYLQSVDEMAKLGLNALEVVTPVFQTNGASHQIRIETGLGRGPSRERLATLLDHAHKRGLKTTLMPVVLFSNPRGNEWRGKISPQNWDQWWADYRKMIDYFLDIANETHVDWFCVGSELLTTEKHAERWKSLIAYVRGKFKGSLLYSTNWDHYHVPVFWRELDAIGISGYWDLTTLAKSDQPTDDQLAQRWQQIRRKLLAFGRTQDRPILITEIGYPSLPWALKDPWNYINTANHLSDPHTQARGYRSFLRAWGDLLSRSADTSKAQIAGVFFYEWSPYHQGGEHDTGYGVRGKPALQIVKKWLADRRQAPGMTPR